MKKCKFLSEEGFTNDFSLLWKWMAQLLSSLVKLSVKLSGQQSLPFTNWNRYNLHFCLHHSFQFYQKSQTFMDFRLTESEQSKLNQSWVSWYLFVLFGTFHDLVLQIHDNTKTKSIHSLFANVSMIEMVSLPPPSYSLYNWHIQCLWFIKNKVLLFRSTKELRMWIKDSVAVDDFKINTMEKIISERQFLFSTDFMRFVAVQFSKLLTFIPQSHISS